MKYLQRKTWNYVIPGNLEKLEDYRFNKFKELSNRLEYSITKMLYNNLAINLERKFSTTPVIIKVLNNQT